MSIKLLVVETSPSVRAILEIGLSRPAFELYFASSGEEALSILNENHPDVILVNPNFSDTDGFELVDFFRTQDALKAVPVVLIPGAFDGIDEERAALLACEETLRQPFSSKNLESLIRSLAEAKDLPQSLPEEPVLDDHLPSGWREEMRRLIKEELEALRHELSGEAETRKAHQEEARKGGEEGSSDT